MRKSITLLVLFLTSVFAAQSAKADDVCTSVVGNLVQNCGFEASPDFTKWSGTVLADPFALASVQFNPYSGEQAASFGPTTQDDTLFQTILNTVAGATYTIQFALDNDTSADPAHGFINNFSASFGGVQGFSETNAPLGDYAVHTFTGVATGSSTDLTFSFENQAGFFYVDSVSVQAVPSAVPEPTSLMLLGTGVAGFAGAIRRRLKR